MVAKSQIRHEATVRPAAQTETKISFDDKKHFERAFEQAFKDALNDSSRLKNRTANRLNGASFRSI
jgi:hypothetical protein